MSQKKRLPRDLQIIQLPITVSKVSRRYRWWFLAVVLVAIGLFVALGAL